MATVTKKGATKRTTRTPKRPRTPSEAPAAVAQGGHRLRTMRDAAKLTQRDIADKTRGQLTNQQVNRIELGKIDKPPMRDLVLYGQVFGLSPNEVAALYGYWTGAEDTKTAEDDPLVIQARNLLKDGVMTPKARAMLLRWIAFGITEATLEMAP